jgi:hypothetical protein
MQEDGLILSHAWALRFCLRLLLLTPWQGCLGSICIGLHSAQVWNLPAQVCGALCRSMQQSRAGLMDYDQSSTSVHSALEELRVRYPYTSCS